MGLGNHISITEIHTGPSRRWVGAVKKVPVKNDAKVDTATQAFDKLKAALVQAGITEPILSFILIQDWMESGAFTNTGWKNNNPGNIVYVKTDPYSSKGPAMSGNPGYYWAKYKTLGDYVKAKIKVLSKGAKPIDATSDKDYVHRLKLNNYFGSESEDSYYAKLKAAAQRIRLLDALVTDSHQDIVTPDKKTFPVWAKWVIGGAVGMILFNKLID